MSPGSRFSLGDFTSPPENCGMPRPKAFDEYGLQEIVRRDAGVVTHRELRELGLPSSTLCNRIRADGPWQRLLPGVVLTYTGPSNLRQRLIAALKYAGSPALLTGAAALHLSGFRSVPRVNEILLLVPGDKQPASVAFVVIERTIRMPAFRKVSGLSCAPLPRAVMDHARRLQSVDGVRAVIAESVQRHGCAVADLARELREGTVRGSALPRMVMREITVGIRSVGEAHARETLRRFGVREPDVYNAMLYDPVTGEFIACPDGYYEDVGVALESDSMEFHLDPESYKRTQRRQRRMASYGIIVVPAAPGDVATDPRGFARSVDTALRAAEDRPTPRVRVVAKAA